MIVSRQPTLNEGLLVHESYVGIRVWGHCSNTGDSNGKETGTLNGNRAYDHRDLDWVFRYPKTRDQDPILDGQGELKSPV